MLKGELDGKLMEVLDDEALVVVEVLHHLNELLRLGRRGLAGGRLGG